MVVAAIELTVINLLLWTSCVHYFFFLSIVAVVGSTFRNREEGKRDSRRVSSSHSTMRRW